MDQISHLSVIQVTIRTAHGFEKPGSQYGRDSLGILPGVWTPDLNLGLSTHVWVLIISCNPSFRTDPPTSSDLQRHYTNMHKPPHTQIHNQKIKINLRMRRGRRGWGERGRRGRGRRQVNKRDKSISSWLGRAQCQ